MSVRTAIGMIKEYWPDHASCLGTGNPPVEDATEGIVCPCGTILGWPQVDEPDDTPPPGHSAPDGSYVSGLDDPDPEDWPAAAAEQQMIVESEPAANVPAVKHGAVSTVQAEDPIESALQIIDPTMPYGPAEIESQLIDIAARLERGVHFQRGWEERNYQDKIAFDLKYNEKLLESNKSSADLRKAEAILACEELYRAKAISDMMVRCIRQTMHDLRALQSGYQTISNSVKASTQSYVR